MIFVQLTLSSKLFRNVHRKAICLLSFLAGMSGDVLYAPVCKRSGKRSETSGTGENI